MNDAELTSAGRPGIVNEIGPLVAPVGTVNTTFVSATLTTVASTPSTDADVTEPKSMPVTVTFVPT